MKLLLFNGGRPGLLRGTDSVVDIGGAVRPFTNATGQPAMTAIIENFDALREEFNRAESEGPSIPLSSVTLDAPLPAPGKILCMGGNYGEFGHRPPAQMWGFLKSPSAVIGHGGTVVLPPDDANIFHHEAELVLVFGRGGRNIKAADAFDYVFGYTVGVDVSARIFGGAPGGRPPSTSMPVSPSKSYPTFAPMGPWIVTRDEVPNPQDVLVQLWDDGELRGDFRTSDMAHSIAESIGFVSSLESVSPGDLLYTGTNHQGLGAMQDGETIDVEIELVGRLSFNVKDPLKRRWQRGVDHLTAEDVRQGAGGPGRRVRPL